MKQFLYVFLLMASWRASIQCELPLDAKFSIYLLKSL